MSRAESAAQTETSFLNISLDAVLQSSDPFGTVFTGLESVYTLLVQNG